jgi:membrane protein
VSERTPPSDAVSDPAGDEPVVGEVGVRERFDAFSQPIRDRLEEPISRVSTITRKTMGLFPVRVWRHFLARNGFLLSSGMSYQALFAIFAAVYVVFAIAGLWLTGDPDTLDAFVKLLNTYAPGLIGDNGIISTEDLTEIATSSTSLFGLTGAVALIGLIWTAIGWVTYSRLAVRSIFGLPKDTRAYALLKARDFLAALVFGTALLVAAVLSAITISFLDWLTEFLGLGTVSTATGYLVQVGGFVVVFAIDTLALAVLFRFLSGAAMPWRRMWIGSLLGSAALTVLQLVSGFLVSRVSTNPLLATFTVFIGLLLWFRLTSIVILVAASWVAVEASDHNETLRRVTPEQLLAEQRERERTALLTAAQVRVREARAGVAEANWWGRFAARRRLALAEQELEYAEAYRGPPSPPGNEAGGLP